MRNRSLTLPANPHPNRTDNWLLDLPTEIRQSIYRYLFCDNPSSIWIARHYKSVWLIPQPSEPEPVFQTQVFRLCKAIHDDAVGFAYGFNDFEVKDEFGAFCRLGTIALCSIRNLTLFQGAWRGETDMEAQSWGIIQSRCSGLENLELVLHADMLLPAIPYLDTLRSRNTGGSTARVAVDLHVWDKAFVFEMENRDYMRTWELLKGTHVGGPNSPKFIPPNERIMRLPIQARQIVLTADVTPGTIRAIDDYIDSFDDPPLVKSSKSMPMKGYRAVGGRSSRFWYDLKEQ